MDEKIKFLQQKFSRRELQLILNCLNYVDNDPAGLPGHNLMLIVAKFVGISNIDQTDLEIAIQTFNNESW